MKKSLSQKKLNNAYLFVLKTSFMIAALDGEVAESEYKAFFTVATEYLGMTREEAWSAIDEAMYSAGYLVLYRQHADERMLVNAFLSEVNRALTMALGRNKFLFDRPEGVRHAFAVWTFMALADGKYEAVERKAVQAVMKSLSKGTLPLCAQPAGITVTYLKKVERIFEKASSAIVGPSEKMFQGSLPSGNFASLQEELCALIASVPVK